MTQQNRMIAKYRVIGLTVIIVTLFAFAFSLLLIQEQVQLSARAQYRVTNSR